MWHPGIQLRREAQRILRMMGKESPQYWEHRRLTKQPAQTVGGGPRVSRRGVPPKENGAL